MNSFLLHRSPVLAWGGMALLLVGIILIPVHFLEDRVITGQPAWIKPIKFALSGGIFLLTMAWLLGDFKLPNSLHHSLSWGFTVIMCAEVLLIGVQAYRGVPSHFNISSPLNASIFSSMGVLIGVNTLLLVWLLYSYGVGAWGSAALPTDYRWGVFCGLALLLFSSFVGGYMSQRFGHAVGAPEDGPGLPLLGWSTTGGDLRYAHFLGMHALQAVLLVWFVLQNQSLRLRGIAIATVLLLFGAATVYTYWVAMRGKPVLG
jgi:hypothetical protein